MKLEHCVRMLPIDEALQGEVDKLKSQGWDLFPGMKGQAIYHLVRVKQAETAAGIGQMTIDDSKVMIIPADKLNGG